MNLKKKIKDRIVSLLLVFLTCSLISLQCCVTAKKTNEVFYYKKVIPPGTTKVWSNLFYDKAEIGNLSWLEFMYWTERVFGRKSEEFNAILPDTTVWEFKDYPCLIELKDIYLKHPAYYDNPVVGISQKQAENFAKWRSDRVFEIMLITCGKVKINPNQDKTNYFSIENYFKGNYNGYIPDSNFRFYPQYRLPTILEWRKALNYSDSIDQLLATKHKSRHLKGCKNFSSGIYCDIVPCINDTLKIDPTRPFNKQCLENSNYLISDLRGNVSEWTSEYETCIGGGWFDTKQSIITKDTSRLKTSNAWTGSRNVCEWKEWKEWEK